MEFIIPITIYLIVVGYLIVRMLTALFNSKNNNLRRSTFVITFLFLGYQIWDLIPFLQNRNGKSFTVGWFALSYSFVILFTIFAIICLILRTIDKRL